MLVFWVFIGCALGGMIRYTTSEFLALYQKGDLPWGTLAVNLTGSFLIGLATPLFYSLETLPQQPFTLFLMTGLLGGLTTFSTLSWQTLMLGENKGWRRAGTNILGNLIPAIGLCALGLELGGLWQNGI